MDLYNNVTFVQKWDWANASFFFASVVATLLQWNVASELARVELNFHKRDLCNYGADPEVPEDGGERIRWRTCSRVWWTVKLDWWATWWAHTLCFFLGVPQVLRDILLWVHPYQRTMGKSCASVMGAHVFASRWPSKLHYLCDDDFGSHMLLWWQSVSKLV